MQVSDIKKTFGFNVRRLREQAKLNQKDFAQRIGAKQSYVSQLESGLKGFTSDSLTEISGILGCQPFELLRPPLSPIAEKIEELEGRLVHLEDQLVHAELEEQAMASSDDRGHGEYGAELTRKRDEIEDLVADIRLVQKQIARFKTEYPAEVPKETKAPTPAQAAMAQVIAEQQKEIEELRARIPTNGSALGELIEEARHFDEKLIRGFIRTMRAGRLAVDRTTDDKPKPGRTRR